MGTESVTVYVQSLEVNIDSLTGLAQVRTLPTHNKGWWVMHTKLDTRDKTLQNGLILKSVLKQFTSSR